MNKTIINISVILVTAFLAIVVLAITDTMVFDRKYMLSMVLDSSCDYYPTADFKLYKMGDGYCAKSTSKHLDNVFLEYDIITGARKVYLYDPRLKHMYLFHKDSCLIKNAIKRYEEDQLEIKQLMGR